MSLAALLAATPLPPTDGDLDAACRQMIEARGQILAAMTACALSADERALVDELALRDAAWQIALAQAQRAVGDQRIASRKVRAYSDDRQIRRHR